METGDVLGNCAGIVNGFAVNLGGVEDRGVGKKATTLNFLGALDLLTKVVSKRIVSERSCGHQVYRL